MNITVLVLYIDGERVQVYLTFIQVIFSKEKKDKNIHKSEVQHMITSDKRTLTNIEYLRV